MATRDKLVVAVTARYGLSRRAEKKAILDEFTAITGLHRKHAMRLVSPLLGQAEVGVVQSHVTLLRQNPENMESRTSD